MLLSAKPQVCFLEFRVQMENVRKIIGSSIPRLIVVGHPPRYFHLSPGANIDNAAERIFISPS